MSQHNKSLLREIARIAEVSHEMRDPLEAILGHAETMYDSRQSLSERLNAIGRIRKNVDDLNRLIEDITTLAKLQTGQFAVQRHPVDLKTELTEFFHVMECKAMRKGLHFVTQFLSKLPPLILTDMLRVRQILGQLVENAIKQTERGSVHVTVQYRIPNQQLAFLVQDNSRAIPPHEIARVWEAYPQQNPNSLFSPTDNANSLTAPILSRGNEMGLRLSRQIAQILGGELRFLPSPSRGLESFEISKSTSETNTHHFQNFIRGGNAFLLTLPAPQFVRTNKSPNAPHPNTEFSESGSFPKGASIPFVKTPLTPLPLHSVRILVVEDATEIRLLLSDFLRRQGAFVDTASQGEEAIQKAKQVSYDFMLLDLQLPRKNGIEVARELETLGIRIPIVVLTSQSQEHLPDDLARFLIAGYLRKPIRGDQLLKTALEFVPSKKNKSRL